MDENLTGAARPINIGKLELLMVPLADIDIAEINNWLRAEYVRSAISAIDDNTPDKLANRIIEVAQKSAANLTMFTEQGIRMLTDIAGISRIIWQCSRKHNPNVTHADIKAAMLSAGGTAIREYNRAFGELNRLPATLKRGNKGKGNQSKKVQRGRKKRQR